MSLPILHTLKHEHRVIEQVLRALEGICFRLAYEEKLPTAALTEVVDFMNCYVDQYHHTKEEAHLFPPLERQGIVWQGGPLGHIEHEHELERKLTDALHIAIQGLQAGSEASRSLFLEAARKYVAHLTNHMQQEEAILFRLADELLVAVDCEGVAAGFRQAEDEFSAARIGQYEALATKLEEQWAL